MDDKKQKYAYWMRPSMVEEIESMLDEADATSKSDFVCQAVKFYIAYLRQKKSIDFISPLLAQTIKTEIESVEHNLSEMLFKVAVEQAVENNIAAAYFDVDENTLKRLRDFACDWIASINGVLSFKGAYDHQRGNR